MSAQEAVSTAMACSCGPPDTHAQSCNGRTAHAHTAQAAASRRWPNRSAERLSCRDGQLLAALEAVVMATRVRLAHALGAS
jgi:hypothetical protein